MKIVSSLGKKYMCKNHKNFPNNEMDECKTSKMWSGAKS